MQRYSSTICMPAARQTPCLAGVRCCQAPALCTNTCHSFKWQRPPNCRVLAVPGLQAYKVLTLSLRQRPSPKGLRFCRHLLTKGSLRGHQSSMAAGWPSGTSLCH